MSKRVPRGEVDQPPPIFTADVPRRKRRPATIPHNPNVLLTSDQAAARLNVKVEQLIKFVGDGDLKFINVGRGSKRPRYRFTNADLDAFVEARTKKQEHFGCLSTVRKNTSTTTSPSTVVGFMARRAAQLSAKPKSSKR